MATTEERMMILRMIEQGKISAEDGARLLAALVKGRSQDAAAPRPTGFDTTRTLQVRVTELGTNRPKANVVLPVGLVVLALRRLRIEPNREVAQLLDAIDRGTTGKFLEVVDRETGVRVELRLT